MFNVVVLQTNTTSYYLLMLQAEKLISLLIIPWWELCVDGSHASHRP
ncbi:MULTISPECIES: hypothetical protein [Okeania]|nr:MULTISPECIES: hypothetical protein [Okeania]NET14981.1 hypothetical protein [Okeania sp. SIO1H6]NES77912.1 hypothetical protein [Okeania sp. SIO1H4]NES90589.1 hypothetical protein [Okeania sp. SIO2B9]NET21441.1 hypothetical protein [Okeania sp. SIO1H5]NET79344.1 hypothetical protein [Okeania sp. SIO1F9]